MPQIIDLKNQPIEKTDVQSEPSSETEKPRTIEWQAPEFEKYEKDKSWFIKLGLFVLIFFIISILSKNFLFSLILLLAGFSVYVYAQKKPRLITFKISARGIVVDKALYPFEDLKSFWIFYEPPEVKYLSLRSKKRLMPYIHLPLGEQNPVEVRKILIKFLPEIHQEESTTDVLARRLRF